MKPEIILNLKRKEIISKLQLQKIQNMLEKNH